MSESGSISPEEVDFSVIRTSIDMGHSMIDQILNGIHYGSAEIRRLLREECDFVMECKVCRNLFRSFANFVAHKRVYCLESIEEKAQRDNLISEEIETVVIQPESPERSVKQKTDERVNDSVINQVVNSTYKSNSKEYKFYTKVAEKIVNAKSNKVTNTITLKEIPTTSEAVVVEFSKGDSSSGNDHEIIGTNQEQGTSKERLSDPKANTKKKKSTLTEVCSNLLEKQSNISNSDVMQKTNSPVVELQSERARKSVPKKVVDQVMKSSKTPMEVDDVSEWTSDANQNKLSKSSHNTQKKTTPEKMETSPESQQPEKPWIKVCDFDKIYCTKCEKTFSSIDSLKLHAKTLHGEKRATSKCPLCLKELCYFSSVERHLRNVHKKTEVQIAEYRKKMQARSKFVEIITPESKNKLQLSKSATSMWKGWKKCDKCQKYFSKARTYKAHLKTKCSATIRSKSKNVDNTNKSDTKPSSSDGKVIDNSKNIDVSKNIINSDNSTIKSNQSETSKTGNANNFYEEKSVDKGSMLYKALTSFNSNPTKVVYVYPKSPLPDTTQADGKDEDKGIEAIKKGASKDVDTGKEVTKKVASETPNEKMKISTNTRKSIEKEKPQAITDKRESRQRSLDRQIVSQQLTESPKPSFTETKQSAEIPKTNVNDSQHTKETLKTNEELNKLKDRLIAEATGKSPSKPEEKQRWWKANKSKVKESHVKNRSGKRLQLSLTDVRKERTPVKSPDRLSSSSFRSSETSPVRDSPSSTSFPNSPSSADGYSHKFKMSVREMVELVETAGLTKFARERKKHAQTTLNKKISKEGLGGKLIKPMKKNIRGKMILPVKSYSTRLAAGSRNVGNKTKNGLEYRDRRIRAALNKDDNNSDRAIESEAAVYKDRLIRVKDVDSNNDGAGMQQIQSKKLNRELKLLANTAGFNESGYYDTHTGSEGSSSLEDQSEPRQRRDLKERYINKAPRDMTAVNILKQKLMAAQKSVSNSKSVMNKRSPDKDRASNRRSQDKNNIEIVMNKRSPDKDSASNRRSLDKNISEIVVNKRSPDKDSTSNRSLDKSNSEIVMNKRSSDKDNKSLAKSDNEKKNSLDKESNKDKRSPEKDNNYHRRSVDKHPTVNEDPDKEAKNKRASEKEKDENEKDLNEESYRNTRSQDKDNTASQQRLDKGSSRNTRSVDMDASENKRLSDKDSSRNKRSLIKGSLRSERSKDNSIKENTEFDDHNVYENKGSDDKNSSESTRSLDNKDSQGNKSSKDKHKTVNSKSLDEGLDEIKRSQDEGESDSTLIEGENKVSADIDTSKSTESPEKENLGNKSKVTRLSRSSANSEMSSKIDVTGKTNNRNFDVTLDETTKTSIVTVTPQKSDKSFENKSSEEIKKGQKRGGSEIHSAELESKQKPSTGSDEPTKELIKLAETSKGTQDLNETTDTTKRSHDSTDTTKSAGMHRTRLSTGSIFFDSELLKTSPSKFDPLEDRTERREKRVLEVKKKLSLSPSRKNTSRMLPKQKSLRQSFFFTHGYAQCEHCKKIFWKMNRYREHVRKCSRRKAGESTSDSDGSKVSVLQARKKRPLSLSPGNSNNSKTIACHEKGESEDGNTRKRPCLKQDKMLDSDFCKDTTRVMPMPIINQPKSDDLIQPSVTLPEKTVEYSSSAGKDYSKVQESVTKEDNNAPISSDKARGLEKLSNREHDSKETSQNSDCGDITNHSIEMKISKSDDEPGTSTSYLDDSDDESEFSGFSDVDEDDKETDNAANDEERVVRAENQDIDNENPLSDEPVLSNENKGRITRQGGTNRSSGEKKKSNRTLSRSFVCDSDKRGKMVCQVSKDIDKIIDSTNLVCRHCKSKHTSVSNLRQHAIRHLGWKRYRCNLCSFSNYNLSELKLHLSRKHCIKGSEVDVKQYVSDLKTEARNKRVSKRSNTLREHKAKGISTKSSPNVYAKPRPSMSATTTKAGRNIKQDSSGTTSLSPSKADDHGKLLSNSTENSPLSKARQRLSNILKP